MSDINYSELWKEKGYGKDNPLENTMAIVRKKCIELGGIQDYADDAIISVLMDIAEGIEYSQTECPCGCGIDKTGTAATHEMMNRMIASVEDGKQILLLALEEKIRERVRKHTKKKARLLDWSKSPTVKVVKHLFDFEKSPTIRMFRK